MEVFKWEPLQGSNEGFDEKVKEVQFGDGYSQVQPDGLNSIRRTFNGLQFKRGNPEMEKEIKDFFLRHGRSKSFKLETTRFNAVVRFSSALSMTKSGGVDVLSVSMKEVFV